jgi:hypothetical protein
LGLTLSGKGQKISRLKNPENWALLTFPAGTRAWPLYVAENSGRLRNFHNRPNHREGLPMGGTAQKREQGPSITVPVDQQLLARVKTAAEREDRSVASFARIALAKALEQQGAAA